MTIERWPEAIQLVVKSLSFPSNRLLDLMDDSLPEQVLHVQFDHKVGSLILPQGLDDYKRPWSKHAIKYQLANEGLTLFEWPELVDSIHFVVDELAMSGFLRNKIGDAPKVPLGKRTVFYFRQGEQFLEKVAKFRIHLAENVDLLSQLARQR